MKNLKNLFLFNKKTENNKGLNQGVVDQFIEISKLTREARIQRNLTIQELSYISKIPEQIINSIENNDKNTIPKVSLYKININQVRGMLVIKKIH